MQLYPGPKCIVDTYIVCIYAEILRQLVQLSGLAPLANYKCKNIFLRDVGMTVPKLYRQGCCMETKTKIYGMRNKVQYEAKE